MQHYKMDKCPSLYTPHTLVFSHRIHIRQVYPFSDLKDREKICATPVHYDTDNRRSISDTHSTVRLLYPYHYGNEHICFHDLLVSLELEPLIFPYLGTNSDTCSIFFIKINQTFFQSADHITSFNRLWNFNR